MNTVMAVNTKTNSQILGLSVIVVSFLASQKVSFGKPFPSRAKKLITEESFDAKDGSVHMLDPNEENGGLSCCEVLLWKTKGQARLAMTFCWLGHGVPYLCGDYHGKRKAHRSIWVSMSYFTR